METNLLEHYAPKPSKTRPKKILINMAKLNKLGTFLLLSILFLNNLVVECASNSKFSNFLQKLPVEKRYGPLIINSRIYF